MIFMRMHRLKSRLFYFSVDIYMYVMFDVISTLLFSMLILANSINFYKFKNWRMSNSVNFIKIIITY